MSRSLPCCRHSGVPNRGKVAMMFALALVPLTIRAVSACIFARAMLVRQQIAEALDAAALGVGSSNSADLRRLRPWRRNISTPTIPSTRPISQPTVTVATYDNKG